jgi:pyruvate/2-oxoglutarate dehydrogenase complex dihydrolipoamide dehydrogenase (E3) component
MPEHAFDAIIIGTGQAGPPLAARLAREGRKIAVIERDQFGGTCVNNGCTPTKTMVASAYAAHLARRAAEYGVVLDGDVRVDMRRVKARKDEVVAHSNQGVANWMRENATVFLGHGRFTGPRSVRVNEDTLTAPQIFLDVGARPSVPKIPGIESVPYYTNVTLMDVDFLPEHLVIVGGSYVGLEFAQMFRRFGSRVTVVEMAPRLIAREDEDVSAGVQQILEREGVHFRLGAKCLSVRRAGSNVEVSVDCTDGAPKVVGSHLLLAVGRTPNTDDLGVEQAGIALDDKGYIKVDDGLRTTNSGVWALGECNGRGAFTHTSYNDYEIVADNLLNGAARKVTDRVTAYALFTDPPFARIGMSESEIRRAGIAALVGRRPMTRVSRAVERGETQGFMKVLVEASSKRILGMHILGTSGDEAVHSVLDAICAKLPYTDVQHGVRIHPTVSELIPAVLGDLHPLEG